jgi:hypothetical protein
MKSDAYNQARNSGCRSIPLAITPQHTTEARVLSAPALQLQHISGVDLSQLFPVFPHSPQGFV